MTTTSTASPASVQPTGSLDRLGAIVRDEAVASDENGGLTPIAAAAFAASGVVKLDLPEELGGFGNYEYGDWARAVENLSRYNTAAGWILHAAGGFTGLFAAMLPDAGAQALWGGSTSATIVGLVQPRGRAVRTENGYRVEGKYQFASGANVATHFTAACYVYNADGSPVLLENGSPLAICGVLPREQVVLQGNWEVFGLRATSSIDYEVPATVISDDFVFGLNPWPEVVNRGAPRHRVGPTVHASVGQTPVFLGSAKGVLEEVASVAQTRKRRDGAYPTVADQPAFRHDITVLDGDLNAVRLAFYDFVDRLNGVAVNGEGPLDYAWGDRARQVGRQALDVALRSVDFACYWAGSSALRSGNSIGRRFLDVHAMNLHITQDRNILIEAGTTVLADLVHGWERGQSIDRPQGQH
jgi:alkylation response protein AidB-like acyl-CoA dehydrogenase